MNPLTQAALKTSAVNDANEVIWVRFEFAGPPVQTSRDVFTLISETINPADFKFFFMLLRSNFIINDPGLHLVRSIYRPGFIYTPAISSDSLLRAFDIKLY